MKIDFSSIIDKRKNVLEQRKGELNKLKNEGLRISDSVEFSISEIPETAPRGRIGIKKLDDHIANVKGAVVYIYEMVNPEIKNDLLKSIEKYKACKDKRNTVKIPDESKNNSSNILYVGSIEETSFLSRTKQHLGLLTKDTWALQLKYWADKKWKFRLYYIQIKNKAVVKEFEAAISDALKPLVGKREK